MDPNFARDLSQRFAALMAEKRRGRAAREGTQTGATPTIPVTATAAPAAATTSTASAPTNYQHEPFYREVVSLSFRPHSYLVPGLLDRALETLDLGKIYGWAEEFGVEFPELGHQDCVIKGLLRFFKRDFFTWVDAPPCARCGGGGGGVTEMLRVEQPSPEERRRGADRTEVFRCKTDGSHIERFPRYDDPATLLETRRGRCGEWANCFTLCCLALGSRARWVWNAEDHVWTEVYSEKLQRWVHCDSCEDAFDQPQVYAVGWGKKMSYCLAFSAEGAQDVTRRYVRQAEHALDRNRGSEECLKAALRDINDRCRGPADAERLQAEDEAEELELAAYVAGPTPTAPQEERPRESGAPEWKEARGEDGRHT